MAKTEQKDGGAMIVTKHLRIFLVVIFSLITTISGLIGLVYKNHVKKQEKFNQEILLLMGEFQKTAVSVEAVKKYLLLRDGISIDKIEDQQLWDELIRELKETSNSRSIRMKEIVDSTP